MTLRTTLRFGDFSKSISKPLDRRAPGSAPAPAGASRPPLPGSHSPPRPCGIPARPPPAATRHTAGIIPAAAPSGSVAWLSPPFLAPLSYPLTLGFAMHLVDYPPTLSPMQKEDAATAAPSAFFWQESAILLRCLRSCPAPRCTSPSFCPPWIQPPWALPGPYPGSHPGPPNGTRSCGPGLCH